MMTEHPILFSGEMVRAILEERKTQTRRVIKPQPPEWAQHVNEIHHLNYQFKNVSAHIWQWSELEQNPPRALRRWPTEKVKIGRKSFDQDYALPCPYGQPGDRLWVRETHHILDMRPDVTDTPSGMLPLGDCPIAITYRADDFNKRLLIPREEWRRHMDNDVMNWRPAIFMPRWASRLTVEITKVRVERVQEITEADIIAEGISKRTVVRNGKASDCWRWSFAELWDSINAKRGFGWKENPWVWVIEFKRIASGVPSPEASDLPGKGPSTADQMEQDT